MKRVYICHYGEVGLKGGNRALFERQLRLNIKSALEVQLPAVKAKLQVISKRFVVWFDEPVENEKVESALRSVFGLVNFNPALEVAPDITAIQEAAVAELRELNFESFAIRAKRADKNFPLNSQQINVQVGAHVVNQMKKKVNLTTPDITCYVEVLRDKAFVYAGKLPGPGGLPVGTAGKVLVLLSGGFDSPVAAYRVLKRGARCDFIHFHSFPFTEKTSQEKVKRLADVLNRFQFRAKLFMVPFAETQKEIVLNCPDRLRVILYRRFMMRIAEKVARRHGYKAIITGESLGQVASQTLENMAAIEDAAGMPILRPLVGFDKSEIIDLAREIGTYEISALPHDDACTRFMPRHPEIHARVRDVRQAEEALDVEKIVARNLREIETIDL